MDHMKIANAIVLLTINVLKYVVLKNVHKNRINVLKNQITKVYVIVINLIIYVKVNAQKKVVKKIVV